MLCFFPAIGPVPSPFDSFLVNRGLKTLHVRMKEHQANGLAVAKFLEADSRVEKVLHPGKWGQLSLISILSFFGLLITKGIWCNWVLL